MATLAPGTPLVRADRGTAVPLADLPSGAPVWALAGPGGLDGFDGLDRLDGLDGLDGHLRPVPVALGRVTHASAVVHEVRLASGRAVAAAGDDRLLTFDGWVPVDGLRIGARVALPRTVPEPVDPASWPDDEVVLLAHLLGDAGALTSARRPLCYRTATDANADAVEKAAAHFGVVARRVRHGDCWRLSLPSPPHLPRGARHPVLCWLDQLGIGRVAPAHAAVPPQVFGLERRQLALFIRHLWAAGGLVRLGDGGQALIAFTSPSRALLDDIQAALLRFGVLPTVRAAGRATGSWHLLVQGREAQYRFVDEIGLHSSGGPEAQRVARYLAVEADERLSRRRAGVDVGWDVVTGVHPVGRQPVCVIGGDASAALVAGGIAVAGPSDGARG
jgi:replicative DNA helicase